MRDTDRIRPAATGDAGALLEIYRYYVERTAISFEWETPSPEEFRGRIAGTLKNYPYLAAVRDGRVVGYAYAGPFSGRKAYSWSAELTVYIAPEAHKQGLGRALYEALERELAGMGVRNLYACVAVPAEQEDEYLSFNSARFHARMGFVKCGEFHKCGCKFGRWYNMIWMEKLIGEHGNEPEAVRRFGREEVL